MKQQTKRPIIGNGCTLELVRKNNCAHKIKFRIRTMEGEGGSAVCYGAECDGKTGRLKEFFPINLPAGPGAQLTRTTSNQLLPVGQAATEQFKAARAEFVGAYETLEYVKQSHKRVAILNNYIPPFEVLYGVPDQVNDTVSAYIWTPDDKQGESFDRYLKRIRKQGEKKAAFALYHILQTVEALSDCVCILHFAGVLHLDLKPSNFMVLYNSKQDIMANAISLYDVNTLYPMDSTYSKIVGTEGYMAPEMKLGRVDNRSDIYALGCILYNSIVSDGSAEANYHDEYYKNINVRLSASPLLHCSALTSNVYLQSKLCEILKKCLAPRSPQRYDCCEELTQALQEAIALLTAETQQTRLGPNKKLSGYPFKSAIEKSDLWDSRGYIIET